MEPSTSDSVDITIWGLDDDLSKSIWVTDPQAYKLLLGDLEPEKTVTLEEIIDKSDSFPIKFPVESVRCKELQKRLPKERLDTYINSAYPVMHEKALQLCAQFLMHKAGPAGSEVERELYKDMDVVQLVDRLLTKRASSFSRIRVDSYMLRDGTEGAGNWESIGTDSEVPPLVLKDYISYDEIKLSALLSKSCYTHFINFGDKKTRAVYVEERINIGDEGVIVSLIGSRLVKKHVMDYQELIYEQNQNRQKSIFLDFFQEPQVEYSDLVAKNNTAMLDRFTEFKPGCFFDNHVYAKRLLLSFDVLLYEANERAKVKGTTAFVHLVGIGLGVSKLYYHRTEVFVDTCLKRIEKLGKHLSNVSDVCFEWIEGKVKLKYSNGDKILIADHPKGGINIHMNLRNPNVKLKGVNEGKLRVVSFPGHGNALPGNRFWKGLLASSADSTTASSTQITELFNPYINPKVCANNLRIVTVDGLVPFMEFRDKVTAIRESNQKED